MFSVSGGSVVIAVIGCGSNVFLSSRPRTMWAQSYLLVRRARHSSLEGYRAISKRAHSADPIAIPERDGAAAKWGCGISLRFGQSGCTLPPDQAAVCV